jgi:hypothetical protein
MILSEETDTPGLMIQFDWQVGMKRARSATGGAIRLGLMSGYKNLGSYWSNMEQRQR